MKSFVFILFLSIVIGCGQSAKPISKNIKEGFHLKSASKSCSSVDLYKDLTTKSNVISLFKCIGYDKKFKEIYSSLLSADEKEFAKLNTVLNQSFFESIESRNKLLGTIISKTQKNSSAAISHLASKFIENPKNLVALKEMLLGLSHKETKVSSQFLTSYLEFMSGLNNNVEISRKKLAKAFNQDHFKKDFSYFLKIFFEDILLDQSANSKENFISYIGEGEWFLRLLGTIGKEDFKKMIFFISNNQDFMSGIKTYSDAISTSKYDCADQSGSYVVDHAVEYRWQIENLYSKSLSEFGGEIVNLITRFNLYNQICHEKDFIQSTGRLLQKFTSFLSINGSFEVMKNFARVSLEDPSNIYILLDFFTSKSFSRLEVLLDELKTSPQFIDGIYGLLTNLSSENLQSISLILNSLIEDETFSSDLRYIWNNELDTDTKYALIDYVTDMFMTDKDIYPAFQFLNEIVKNQKNESDIFVEKFLSSNNISSLSLVIDSILSNESLYLELHDFLDSNSLFELLSLLQRSDTAQEAPKKLESKSENLGGYVLPETQCISRLVDIKFDASLAELIESYPVNCLGDESPNENFAIKIMRWSKNMNRDFELVFKKKLVGDLAILNHYTMHFLHQMVHVTTKFVNHSEDFSKRTVNSVKNFFFNQKGINKLEESLFKYLEYDSDGSILKKLLSSVINSSEEVFETSIKGGFETISLLTNGSTKAYDCDKYIEFGVKCSLDLSGAQESISQNFLNLNQDVFINVLGELKKSGYSIEDYLELFRFLGEPVNIKSTSIKLPRAYKVEQILKAVDFSNNYYAIYFLSKLARSSNYKNAVAGLKSDFSMVMKLTPVLSRIGVHPRDSRQRFSAAYDNLDILDDLSLNIKNKDYSYGDVLIGLSRALNNLSPRRSRKIRKVSIPNKNKVIGHYGHFLAAGAKEGLLSHAAHYLFLNLNANIVAKNDYKVISKFIELSKEISFLSNQKLKLSSLPINKEFFTAALVLPNESKEFYSKLLDKALINKLSFNISKGALKLDQFNLLFQILADKDVDYISFHKALVSIHTRDDNYFFNLLQYSLMYNGPVTNLSSGLEQMFIESNSSLILFFEDILAHFKIK